MNKQSINLNEEHESTCIPERVMWLAIIERALKDYAFFFDRLATFNANKARYPFYKLGKNPRKKIEQKAISEFFHLHDYIFNTTPKPNNVEYISRMLFDETMAKHFRKIARQQFANNILKLTPEHAGYSIAQNIKERL